MTHNERDTVIDEELVDEFNATVCRHLSNGVGLGDVISALIKVSAVALALAKDKTGMSFVDAFCEDLQGRLEGVARDNGEEDVSTMS